MIITDITGNAGGDASQVFNLLAVVANPEVYGEKLKALVSATEENKKYVALVAPASEILELRKQIETDRAQAAKLLKDAKAEATNIEASAKSKAQAMINETSEVVSKAKALAVQAHESSAGKLAEIDVILKDLQRQLTSAETAEKKATVQIEAAVEAKTNLEAEKTQVVTLKNKLIAKAKAFAEELTK